MSAIALSSVLYMVDMELAVTSPSHEPKEPATSVD